MDLGRESGCEGDEGEDSLHRWTERTVQWMKDVVTKAGRGGVVVGLSGGVDSAVTACLCTRAFPDNSLAVVLPCRSSKQARKDALPAAEACGIEVAEVPLDGVYEAFSAVLFEDNSEDEMARANLKPRLRMAALYYLAQVRNSLVVGTDNRAELYLGYFTKYGDGACDLLPLANLLKSQVFAVAEHLGVPAAIIQREPSAGLWPGQTDEEELGLSYRQIDAYLEGEAVSREVREKLKEIHTATEHKRTTPPRPPFNLDDAASSLRAEGMVEP